MPTGVVSDSQKDFGVEEKPRNTNEERSIILTPTLLIEIELDGKKNHFSSYLIVEGFFYIHRRSDFIV